MQLTSILSIPSDSGLPASSPAATTMQNDTRNSTTGRHPGLVSGRPPVRTIGRPTSSLPPSDSSASTMVANSRPALCFPVIDELQTIHVNAGGSELIDGVYTDVDHVGLHDLFNKGRLFSFGRDHVKTSASSLVGILAKQSFLGVDNPNLAAPQPIVVIPRSKLHALYMKALLWFITHECAGVDGTVVIFVGKKVCGNGLTRHLALPLAAVRKLADEFGTAGGGQEFDQEFEEFGLRSFHAGHFYMEHSRWAVVLVGFLAIFGLCALIFLFAFFRDVTIFLTVLSHDL